MAVQAQYPSNVLLPDFRTRNGQTSDYNGLLGVGFGSSALLDEYQAAGIHIHPSLNTAHGQRVPSTFPVIFHTPEDQAFNMKRAREPVDLLSLQCKRPSLMNLSDLSQQAPGTVSTGLRLAFEDEQGTSVPNAAKCDSASIFSCLSDELNTKLQQQRDEMDQFLRVQGEHLRQSLVEKRQRYLRSLLNVIEETLSRSLRDKDLEMEKVNRRKMELEERVKQLKLEAHLWQSKARNHEAMVATLKSNLQQAVSILLLPCRHLCLCRDCEMTFDTCPVCHATKNASVEVYMS